MAAQLAATVSVIIPTHNRIGLLRQGLGALRAQAFSLQRVEVIVVADGCADETVSVVEQYEAPFRVRIVEQQPAAGPAAARNRGASVATGELLVFLDDDIEASACLLDAHARVHRDLTKAVAIGYLQPIVEVQSEIDRTDLRNWWEGMFDDMRLPGRRLRYSDLLSGNFSLSASFFEQVGGFDPALRCHEDYELGIRLIKAGATLVFCAEALGFHHEKSDFARALMRKYDEGKADVMIARRHPDVRSALPVASLASEMPRRTRAMVWLAFSESGVGDALIQAALRLANPTGRMQFRRWTRRLRDALLSYWYWRGVAQELTTRDSVADIALHNPEKARRNTRVNLPQARRLHLLQGSGTNVGSDSDVVIDLREGLDVAEQRLESLRPAAVCIRYGGSFIGRIPPHPGTERIRGAHLRPILATVLFQAVYDALEARGELETPGFLPSQEAADVSAPALVS